MRTRACLARRGASGLLPAGADGHAAAPWRGFQAALEIVAAKPLQQALDEREVHPADEVAVLGRAVEGAVAQACDAILVVERRLLFSVERYEQVIEAYLSGLERRVNAGEPLSGLASVASFFVSRVDAKADARLAPDSPLRGRIAVANAQRACGRYLERFAGARWEALRRNGAAPQRPLWASTGTKDPIYRDVMYVEELIAPGVINTMPQPTLKAFADHGNVARALDTDPSAAARVLSEAAGAGLDLPAATAELEREGVRSFCDAYEELLGCIASKLGDPGLARTADS